MDKQMREVLDLFQTALERAPARSWAEQAPLSEMSVDDARKSVFGVFKSQFLDRFGAKDPGAKTFAGMLALQVIFASLPPSEDEIADAIELSQEDYHAFQALRILAQLKIAPDSTALRNWEKNVFLGLIDEPPVPNGVSPYRDAHRNMLIISQLEQLEQAGFKPMRNMQRAANNKVRESGCDIVADALSSLGENVSYAAIERVWKKREEQPKLDYLAALTTQISL